VSDYGLGFTFSAVDAGLTKFQDTVQQGFTSIGETLTGVRKQAGQLTTSFGQMVSGNVTKGISQVAKGYDRVAASATAARKSVQSVVGGIKTWASTMQSQFVAGLKESVVRMDALNVRLQVGFAAATTSAIQSTKALGSAFQVFAKKGWESFAEGAKTAHMWLRDKIPKAWAKLKSKLTKEGEHLGDTGKKLGKSWEAFGDILGVVWGAAKNLGAGFAALARGLKSMDLVGKISGQLEQLKEHVTGLPDALKAGGQLTSQLEGELSGMAKSAKAAGAQLGYTGKELKKFTGQAVAMGRGLNIGEEAAGQSLYAWETYGEGIRAMGFTSAAGLAKFAESHGVAASLLGEVSTQLMKQGGLNAQQADEFMDSFIMMGQKTGDVPAAMEAAREATKQMISKKALGASSAEIASFGKDIASLTVAFNATGMSADEARSAAMSMGETLVSSQREWQDAFAGTSETGMSEFLTRLAGTGADVDSLMATMKQGPMQFVESIQSVVEAQGGWSQVSKEQTNFLRAQLSKGLGGDEAAERMLLLMQNMDGPAKQMVKDVRGAQVSLEKLGGEAFSTGLTLQDTFDRAEQSFVDKFRRISKKEAGAFVKDTTAEFGKFNTLMAKTAADGGPMGMFVKKMAEAHHLGSMAFIPKTMRPMITIFGSMVGQMAPVLTGLGALGLRFSHLVNPVTLAAGAIVGLGVAFAASEKNFKNTVDTLAGSPKAFQATSKEVKGLEGQLAKMKEQGLEGTDQFKDLQRTLGRKYTSLQFAESLSGDNKEIKEADKNLKKLQQRRQSLAAQGKDTAKIDKEIAAAQQMRIGAEQRIADTRKSIGEEARLDSQERIKTTVQEATGTIKGIIQAAPTIVKTVVDFIATEAIPIFKDLWKEIQPGIEWMFTQVSSLPVGKYAAQAWTFLKGAFTTALGYLKTIDWGGMISSALGTASGIVSSIGAFASTAITQGFAALKSLNWGAILSTTLGTLDSLGTSIFSFASSALVTGFGMLQNINWTEVFTKVGSGIKTALGSLVGAIFGGDNATPSEGAISTLATGLVNVTWAAVKASGSLLAGAGAAWWTALKDSVTNADWGSLAKILGGTLLVGMFAIGPIRAAIGGALKSIFTGPASVVKGIFATPETAKEVKEGVEKPLLQALAKYKEQLIDASKAAGQHIVDSFQRNQSKIASVVEKALETAYKNSESVWRQTAQRACSSCSCGGGAGGGGTGGGIGAPQGKKNNRRDRRRGGRGGNRMPSGGSNNRAPTPNTHANNRAPTPNTHTNTPNPPRSHTPMASSNRAPTPSPTPSPTPNNRPASSSPLASHTGGSANAPSTPHINAPDAPRAGSGRAGGIAGIGLAAASFAGFNPTDMIPGFSNDSATGRVGNVLTEEVVEEGVEKGTEKGAAKLAAKSAAKGAAAGAAEGGTAMARFLGKGAKAIPAIGAGIMAIEAGMKSYTALADIFTKDMPTGEAISSSLFAISGSVADTILMGLPSALDPDFVKNAGEGGQLLYKMATLDEKTLTRFGDGFNNILAYGLNPDKAMENVAAAQNEGKANAQVVKYGIGAKVMGAEGGFGSLERGAALGDTLKMIQGGQYDVTTTTALLQDAAKKLGLNAEDSKILMRAAADKDLAAALQRDIAMRTGSVLTALVADGKITSEAMTTFTAGMQSGFGIPDKIFGAGPDGVQGPTTGAEIAVARLQAGKAPVLPGDEGGFAIPDRYKPAPSKPWNLEGDIRAELAKDAFGATDWSAQVAAAPPPAAPSALKRLSGNLGAKASAAGAFDVMTSTNEQIAAAAAAEANLRKLQAAALSVDATLTSLQPVWSGVMSNIGTAWSGVAGNILTVNDEMSKAVSPDKAAQFQTFFTGLWSGASGYFSNLQGVVDEMFGNSISTDVMEDFAVSNEAVTDFLTKFSDDVKMTVRTSFVGGFVDAFAEIEGASVSFTEAQLLSYSTFGDQVKEGFRGMWAHILDMTSTATTLMAEEVATAMDQVADLRAQMDRAEALTTAAAVAQANIVPADPAIVKGSPEHLIQAVHYPDWFMKMAHPQLAAMARHLADMNAHLRKLAPGASGGGAAKAPPAKGPGNARSRAAGFGLTGGSNGMPQGG
jgi:hypothetical protein